jgi:transposase
MARQLLTDEIWELIEPRLPQRPPRSKGGRPPVPDRVVLTGILFILKTGIAWEDLPEEMGCGCGMTCYRRMREWQQAGIWHELQAVLASRLRHADRIDWSRARASSPQAYPSPHPEPDGDGDHRGKTRQASEQEVA